MRGEIAYRLPPTPLRILATEFIVFRRFLTPKVLYSKAQGQRRRESGRAPPWVIVEGGDCRAERLTPKALYRTFDGRFILVERLQRTCFLRLFTQGARVQVQDIGNRNGSGHG